MEEQINAIIDQFRPGIEGDGGSIELDKISADGVIHLHQKENPNTPMAFIWAHRLRVEKAIKKEFPDAQIDVELEELREV